MDSGVSDASDDDSSDDDDDDFAVDLSVCGDRCDACNDAGEEVGRDGVDAEYQALLSPPAKSDCAARRRFSTRRLSSLARHSADPMLALGASLFMSIQSDARTHRLLTLRHAAALKAHSPAFLLALRYSA